MNNPFVALWLVVDTVAVVSLPRLLRVGPSARTSAIEGTTDEVLTLGNRLGPS